MRCNVIAVLAGMTTRAKAAAKQPVYKGSSETPVEAPAAEFTSDPKASPKQPNSEQSAQQAQQAATPVDAEPISAADDPLDLTQLVVTKTIPSTPNRQGRLTLCFWTVCGGEAIA